MHSSNKTVLCHRAQGAGWAVDADTRHNEGSAGTGKGAKGDHKGAYSATILCKHFAKARKVWIPSLVARATKARSRAVREIGARSVEKSRIRHSSSAEAVLTSTRFSSPPEAAPPGLSTPVNSSTNSENVVALVLSLGGSSESPEQRDSRLSPGQLDMWSVKNSLCSQHVIKPSICP